MRLTILVLTMLLAQQSLGAEDKLVWENCNEIVKDIPCPANPPDIENETEKDILLEMTTYNLEKPTHSFVSNWNNNIVYDQVPEDTTPTEHLTIKNAWLKAYTVSPSVKMNDTLYNTDKGVFYSGYYYTLTIPSDYYNGKDKNCGDPGNVNEIGDCKTIYGPNWDISEYNIYQNNKQIGTQQKLNFVSADVNNFESDLKIKNKIQRERWKWEETNDCCKQCCKKTATGTSCWCCKYWYECKYSFIDYRIDELPLTSELQTKKIPGPIHSVHKIVIDKSGAPNYVYLHIDTKNIEKFIFSLGEKAFTERVYSYKIGYSSAPFNVLGIFTREDPLTMGEGLDLQHTKDISNGKEYKLSFGGEDIGKCKIEIKNPFKTNVYDCNYQIMKNTNIKLTLDKMAYKNEEDINLGIGFTADDAPASGKISIIYGEDVRVVDVDSEATLKLKAKSSGNIKAYFKTDYEKAPSNAIVYVTVKNPLLKKIYWTIGIVFACSWLFIYVFRRFLLIEKKT